MKVVAIQGIRNGVGASTAAASIALSLSAEGQRVLCVDAHGDLSGLKVLFNIPLIVDNEHLEVAAFAGQGLWRYNALLDYMEADSFEKQLQSDAEFLSRLQGCYDVLLLDDAPLSAPHGRFPALCVDLSVTLLVPDANAVLRLTAAKRTTDYFILNKVEDTMETERDLVTYIQSELGAKLYNRTIPKDSFVEYCFLNRQPVVQAAPFSASATAFAQTALWIKALCSLRGEAL